MGEETEPEGTKHGSTDLRAWYQPVALERVAVELVYETHSISVDNERGIATGWLPGELSEEGRRLAAELGKRRRHDGIACVFTSDLRRAVETAEIAFAGAASRSARTSGCASATMAS